MRRFAVPAILWLNLALLVLAVLFAVGMGNEWLDGDLTRYDWIAPIPLIVLFVIGRLIRPRVKEASDRMRERDARRKRSA